MCNYRVFSCVFVVDFGAISFCIKINYHMWIRLSWIFAGLSGVKKDDLRSFYGLLQKDRFMQKEIGRELAALFAIYWGESNAYKESEGHDFRW